MRRMEWNLTVSNWRKTLFKSSTGISSLFGPGNVAVDSLARRSKAYGTMSSTPFCPKL